MQPRAPVAARRPRPRPRPVVPITDVTDLPDDILRDIFGRLGPRDQVRASAVCKSWAGAARASHDELWATVVAQHQETAAHRAHRLTNFGLHTRGPRPLSPDDLVGLASFCAVRAPSTTALLGLTTSTPSIALRRLVRSAGPHLRALGLLIHEDHPGDLSKLMKAVAGACTRLEALEVIVCPRDSQGPGERHTPSSTQERMGIALAALGSSRTALLQRLTHLTLDARRGGWVAGPLLETMPRLASLALRNVRPFFPPIRAATLTSLTALDLVGCWGVAIPSLAGVPLARLRVWQCRPAMTVAAAEHNDAAFREAAARGARPPRARSLATAVHAAAEAGAPEWNDSDSEIESDSDKGDEETGPDIDPDLFDGSPWCEGLADVGATLQWLELVGTPLPGAAAAFVQAALPALTRLARLVLDTGVVDGGPAPNLIRAVSCTLCALEDSSIPPVEVDLAPLLAAARRLSEVRLCGTGAAVVLGPPPPAAPQPHLLRILDLRGNHFHTWPPGLGGDGGGAGAAGQSAFPSLTDLFLGFTAMCAELDTHMHDMELDPSRHASFRLAHPPALHRLTRLVFRFAVLGLSQEVDGRPAAWAARLAAAMPALATLSVDAAPALEPTATAYRALGFVDAAFHAAHGRRGVLCLTSLLPGWSAFGVNNCMEDFEWHSHQTDDEDDVLLGLPRWSLRPMPVSNDEEFDDDEPCAAMVARRRARLAVARRVLEPPKAAVHGWHAAGEPCGAAGTCGVTGSSGRRCDGPYCGNRAMRGRLGILEGAE